MIRNTLIASAMALATLSAAQAQDAGPRLVGGGPDATVVYDAPSRNQVGGGLALFVTGGANQRITYSSTVAQPPSGLVAELTGEGENRHVTYHPAATQDRSLAGRTAPQGG